MRTLQTTLLITAIAGLTACSPKDGFKDISAQVLGADTGKVSKYNVNKHLVNKVVCDPWGGENPPSVEHGIKASLFYRGVGVPRFYSAQEYVDLATPSTQSLFFSDLNVPTRMFSEGFSTQSSQVVKDDMGEKLIEYFGMKFTTTLKLKADQAEGDYELGVLADDGVVVKAMINGQMRPLIMNDGDHTTKMGCALSTLNFTRDTEIPIEVTYYQGPRYHIANVLMWRKAAEAGKDSSCGHEGNEHFFDPNNGSVAKQPYKDLLARGWEPISSENFFIPKDESYNPCVEGTAPVLTNFKVLEVFSEGVSVGWRTDLPATAQVLITNVATGETVVTQSDNILRTTHEVYISGLKSGVTYKAQAVSITADLGKGISNEVTFTTP